MCICKQEGIMSKRKKIIIASVVCFVVALTIILSVSLTVGSFENRFIKTMTNLNYNVITSSKRFYFENCTSYCTFIAASRLFLLDSGHDDYEYVNVYIFQRKNDATKFYGKSMTEKTDYERIVQKGNKVFIGTERGLLDFKI